MEKEKRPISSKDTAQPVLSCGTLSNPAGVCMDPWHSTPVKKHSFKSLTESQPPPTRLHFGSAVTLQTEDPLQDLPSDCPQPITGRKHVHKAAVEIESATIQKQRKELQLLVAELKDRDRELNSMVSAHQKQLLAWEEDRQKVLTLEQRCARFENELQKRNEIIRAVTKRIRILEAQQLDRQSALSSTQQLLQDLSEREQETSSQCQDLQEKNQSLNSSVLELSTQIGQLQAREQELGAMLKLKDEDVVEATRHIVDLTGRLRKLEAAVKECRLREDRALKEAQEYKRQLREARREAAKLRDDLQEKTAENNNQKEDVIRLKQEIQLLQSELALAGEGERRKDELLELARSKQERTEMELHCLRQVYENQQNDLQLLQLNLESSQERLKEREGRAQEGSANSSSTSLRPQHESRNEEQAITLSQSAEREGDCCGNDKRQSPADSVKLRRQRTLTQADNPQCWRQGIGAQTAYEPSDACREINETVRPKTSQPLRAEEKGSTRMARSHYKACPAVLTSSEPGRPAVRFLEKAFTEMEPSHLDQGHEGTAGDLLHGEIYHSKHSGGVPPGLQQNIRAAQLGIRSRDITGAQQKPVGETMSGIPESPQCCSEAARAQQGDPHLRPWSESTCLNRAAACPRRSWVAERGSGAGLSHHRPEAADWCAHCCEGREKAAGPACQTALGTAGHRATAAAAGTEVGSLTPRRAEAEAECCMTDLEWIAIFKCIEEAADSRQLSCGAGCGTTSPLHPASQGRLDLGSLHLDSSAVWGGSSPASNRRKQRGSPRLGNGTLELAVSPPKDTVNGEGGPSSAAANSDEQPSLTRLLRLVAESRQMVADLEISTMRPASPAHSLDSSGSSRSVEALDSREQFLRDTQLLEGSTHSKHQNSCSKRSVAGSLLNLDTQQLPVNL
ncbi:coiled-coil domain-containing protein 62 isoform X2 [Lepisosteus oculatus]|uniref:coiled-coil domain-containing protein 62 isoform X2 n=1 Tax=Lepisosteus oculatus TaxID=7918 RepID=UPI0035F52D26